MIMRPIHTQGLNVRRTFNDNIEEKEKKKNKEKRKEKAEGEDEKKKEVQQTCPIFTLCAMYQDGQRVPVGIERKSSLDFHA